MLKKTLLICSTLAAFLILPVQTTDAQMAVGIKAGTAGIGGEFTHSVTGKLNARATGAFFSYNSDGIYEDDPDIAYDMTGNITSIGLVADYFPIRKAFKLSAGLFYHDFTVNGDATPNEPYVMDDKTFQPERLGSLTGKMEYESKIVPYAGLGFGNPVAGGGKLRFNFEIGAMFTNSPSVTMEGEGMIAPSANQDQDFEDEMKGFKFYPVLNLGLSYRL